MKKKSYVLFFIELDLYLVWLFWFNLWYQCDSMCH